MAQVRLSRRLADSNCCKRLCRPLPNHSAKAPEAGIVTAPEVLADAAAVLDFPRTFVTNYKAFYWQSPEGLQYWPYRYADKWMFEDGLDRNPPRAARVYALIAATQYDAFIASQDGKFAYWYLPPAPAAAGDYPDFSGPQLPELSVEPLDLLGGALRNARVPLSDAGRLHSRCGEGSRRLAHLGRHPLSDGQRGRFAAREIRRRIVHCESGDRRLALPPTTCSLDAEEFFLSPLVLVIRLRGHSRNRSGKLARRGKKDGVVKGVGQHRCTVSVKISVPDASLKRPVPPVI